MKQHKNLCSDLSKIVEHDPVKFRKVCDDVIALRETYFETVAREAREEAERKAEQSIRKAEQSIRKAEQKAYEKEVNMVLNMIKENISNEIISRCSDFSLEEITKIREEKA